MSKARTRLEQFGLVLLAVVLFSNVACSKSTPGFSATEGRQIPIALDGEKVSVSGEAGLTPVEVEQLLRDHNRVRSAVGVEPVSWSRKLAEYAYSWAEYLAANGCQIMHRPKNGEWRGLYGENLFVGTAGHYGVVDAVKAWESEKRFFEGDALDLANVQLVGHYTQVVWRDTRQIGCGKAECQGRVIVVCNYDPPGNVLHETPY